ncbi:zinc-binding dehydrogenase [Mycobacterium sp. CVI_P3]|uniref:Zinc-binding dehydrogenase n=1 Tax=Mycobacterium pinniadriaticum TaxID=2994102 RepID=A0ABT3SMW1_9MYCO|nr:zinc-binding dehydrogenase [Mycobacterium pinniadriaticum]MCX2934439.1 zinc-binding dehydrogenase [Mycobacterium pinniadriaticum]MCX2940862.1 zinc-binding dehydrogenase [Mycobacterium pinniadriaticum]
MSPPRIATALVLEGPGWLVTREFPIPALAPGEAILAVEACGLCGTDHEMFDGTMPANLPLIPGHEMVGRIEHATDDFLCSRGLDEGDVVAVEVFQRCGQCKSCRRGAYPLCRKHGMGDSYGSAPISLGCGLWGGYATHAILTADSLVHQVPKGMDPVYATLFNPLGAGIRWGQTLPNVGVGDVVAVLGPGLRGLSSVAAVSNAGAGFILLTGAGARDRTRLKLGERLGANVAVDVRISDAKTLLKQETGGLADIVVDVTAAAPAAFLQAIELARPGGTIVVAGTRGVHTIDRFNPDRLVAKELTLIGARGVDGPAYARALELLADDDRFSAIPHDVAPLDAADVGELLGAMAHGDAPPLHAVVAP